MNYTENTKLNEIPNAKAILDDTIASVKYMYENCTLGYFINTNKETGEQSIATTILGIYFGCGTGAAANVPKKYKGSIVEKIGKSFATWRKNENGADKITSAVTNAKLEMAKNMLLAKMDIKQIATITGLSVDDINALTA